MSSTGREMAGRTEIGLPGEQPHKGAFWRSTPDWEELEPVQEPTQPASRRALACLLALGAVVVAPGVAMSLAGTGTAPPRLAGASVPAQRP